MQNHQLFTGTTLGGSALQFLPPQVCSASALIDDSYSADWEKIKEMNSGWWQIRGPDNEALDLFNIFTGEQRPMHTLAKFTGGGGGIKSGRPQNDLNPG